MSEQGTTAQAKDKAQEVAGQAQEKAQQAAGQARDRLRDQIDERSTMAGDRVSGQASDLRSVSEQLRQHGKDQPARMAEQAADRLQQASSYLRQSDADRILDDVEDFARSNPWAVMAGGLALGFVASRLLKASSQDRYEHRSSMGTIQDRPALPRRTEREQRFSRQPTTPVAPAPPIPPTAGPEVW